MVASLANHFQVADHGILSLDVGHKSRLVHIGGKQLDAGYRFQDMPQKILDAQLGVHSKRASAITLRRKDSGKARGVSTSTLMPSSSDISN